MVWKEHGPICQPIRSQGLQMDILFAKGTVLEFWVMEEKLPHSTLTDGIGQVVECGFGLCQVWGCWCDLGPLCFASKFSSLKWDGKDTHFLALLWEAGEGWFHNARHRSGQSEHQFRHNSHPCAACVIGRALEGKGLLAHFLYRSAFWPSSGGHTLLVFGVPIECQPKCVPLHVPLCHLAMGRLIYGMSGSYPQLHVGSFGCFGKMGCLWTRFDTQWPPFPEWLKVSCIIYACGILFMEATEWRHGEANVFGRRIYYLHFLRRGGMPIMLGYTGITGFGQELEKNEDKS